MDRCAKCLYPLHGLDSLVCPECGCSNDSDSVKRLRAVRLRKRLAIGCVGGLLLAALSCFLSSLTMLGPNLGLPFGYYGELNQVLARIESIEGVRVEDMGVNYDVSVEEMYFYVVIDGTHAATIDIDDVPLAQRLRTVDQWESQVLPTYRKN